MSHYVYILASRPGGALYTDVAPDLARRGCERRERAQAGFGGQSGRRARTPAAAPRLVYFEEHPTLLEALAREKIIRACSREWKIRRIEYMNPDWRDLTPRGGPAPEGGPAPRDESAIAEAWPPRLPAAIAVTGRAGRAARQSQPHLPNRRPSKTQHPKTRKLPPLRYPVS